jgi:hypothetical protein
MLSFSSYIVAVIAVEICPITKGEYGPAIIEPKKIEN